MTDLVSRLRTLDTDHSIGQLYEMYDNLLEHLRIKYEKQHNRSPCHLEEDAIKYKAFKIMQGIYGVKKYEK